MDEIFFFFFFFKKIKTKNQKRTPITISEYQITNIVIQGLRRKNSDIHRISIELKTVSFVVFHDSSPSFVEKILLPICTHFFTHDRFPSSETTDERADKGKSI